MERFAWLLGLRGVLQHGRRNLIAGFAIAIGLMAILTLIGYSKRINDYLSAAAMYLQQPGHVAIVARDGLRKRLTDPTQYSLKAADVSKITEILKERPGFDFAAPYLSGFGLIGNGCKSFPFKASGFDFAMDQRIKEIPELKAVIGDYKAFTKGIPHASSQASSPIGISVGLAKRLEKAIGPDMQSSSEIFDAKDCETPEVKAKLAKDSNVQLMAQGFDNRLNAVDGELVNEFTTGISFTDNSALTMGLTQLQDLLRTDKVSYLAVFLKDRQQAEAFARDIKVEMIRQKIDIDAYAWDSKDWNFNFYASRNVLFVINIFATIVIFVVVILSIINTLNIGLVEARREIGMLRALGYTPPQIAKIFSIEAMCVALLAIGLGCVASYYLFEGIKALQIPFQFPGASQKTIFLVTLPGWGYGAAAFGLVLLVVFTSYTIARRYASKDTLTLLDRGN